MKWLVLNAKNDLAPIKNSVIYDKKLGITNLDNLLHTEENLSHYRELEIREKGLFVDGIFDLAHLQTIHRHLFQDLYPCVGEIRDVKISKGGIFCYMVIYYKLI